MAMSKTLEIFGGKIVYLIIRSVKPLSSGTSMGIKNLVMSGVLIDEDTTNYYIGDDSGEVFIAVSKTETASILSEEAMATMMGDIITDAVPTSGEIQ